MDLGHAARNTLYAGLKAYWQATNGFSSSRSNHRMTTPIQKLPSDILLCISDLLPLSSRAALAISSKWMLKKIGYAAVEDLQLYCNAKQKQDFDNLTAKDHPGWRLCQHCSCFHRVPMDPQGKPWRATSPPRVKAYGFIRFRPPMRACRDKEPDLVNVYGGY